MTDIFSQIINIENLYESWRKFRNGKRNKIDVQLFERNLEGNLFKLYHELKHKAYCHSNYTSFYITDPKQRHIHKAEVLDRIVHHAVYRILYPMFDQCFIHDSYSCRLDKGTHKAVDRLKRFTEKVSRNYRELCFVLKCDIKKFFDSVNHQILFDLIKKKVKDKDSLGLIWNIISSYSSERERVRGLDCRLAI